ncbi:hypothetical protein CRENBAI_026489 [Crenichthys baileyi]|uniref:Uncharacterized protein n=1 Tax=Crenichthys baileyi TaxID=28760 RepID=A0AAV9SNG8_9TELE
MRVKGSTSAASEHLCSSVAFSFHLAKVLALQNSKRMRRYRSVAPESFACVFCLCGGQIARAFISIWNRLSFVVAITMCLKQFLDGSVAHTCFSDIQNVER